MSLLVQKSIYWIFKVEQQLQQEGGAQYLGHIVCQIAQIAELISCLWSPKKCLS